MLFILDLYSRLESEFSNAFDIEQVCLGIKWLHLLRDSLVLGIEHGLSVTSDDFWLFGMFVFLCGQGFLDFASLEVCWKLSRSSIDILGCCMGSVVWNPCLQSLQ